MSTIDKYTPDSLKEHVGSLDNKSLVTLAAVLDGISKDYIGEHNVKGGETPQVDSKADVEKEYFSLLNEQNVYIAKNRGADFTGEAAAMQKKIDALAQILYS